ncbi:uncharacterized protein B0J16DRAFT_383784 [Fusarium flagelliforme]|uniref:uncharacterized protein n=1 Tax=Fusarium flagelliforme TaxID=2675880 RepID=UPI001E8D6F7E|nr:uncharacterized protein B0J16DRAFT_383784 [Fusarium flagelliforme]KAH7184729.1 hypothetical protein B0J16DRAFT_383784 [Fusarium flagelliforme]
MDNETPTATSLYHLPIEMRYAVWEAIAPSGHDAIIDCGLSRYTDCPTKFLTILHHPDVLAARQTCHEAFSFGVDSIATLWPNPSTLEDLYKVLLHRYQLGRKPVKTLYIGISTVVCKPTVSRIANSQLGECGYRVFDLEDEFLPSFLENCHTPEKKHHSDACYIASLHEYWDNHEQAQKFQQTWARLTASHDGKVDPELKPVVIGYESAYLSREQAPPNFFFHVKEAKLAYSRESTGPPLRYYPRRPAYVRAQALREWQCPKCRPTRR